jgi:hypothetical protein
MKGFIGFTALVLISIFLIFLIFSLTQTSFYLFGFLDKDLIFLQLKNYLEGCGEIVLGKLIQNANYSGNENLSWENFSCYVYPVENSTEGYKILKLKGSLLNFSLYLRIIFDLSNRLIIKWEILGKI